MAHIPTDSAWLSYTLGKKLNQHRWRLEQLPFLSGRIDEPAEGRGLRNDIIPHVRDLFGGGAVRLERCLDDALTNWEYILGSESYGEEHDDLKNLFRRVAAGLANAEERETYEFESTRRLARATIDDFCSEVMNTIKEDLVRSCFQLGLLVDLGPRPWNVYESIYQKVMNPGYWEWKRSEHRRIALKEDRRAFAARLSISRSHSKSDDDDEPPDTILVDPKFRRLRPLRTVIIARHCDIRRTPLEAEWERLVREKWTEIGVLGSPPKSLFALYRRPLFGAIGQLVKSIDCHVYRALMSNSVVPAESSVAFLESPINVPVDHTQLARPPAIPAAGVIVTETSPTADSGDWGQKLPKPGQLPEDKKTKVQSAEGLVGNYLRDRQTASSNEIAEALQFSRSTVTRTKAWKKRLSRPRKGGESVYARGDSALIARLHDRHNSSPVSTTDVVDFAESILREKGTPEEREKARLLTGQKKIQFLLDFLGDMYISES